MNCLYRIEDILNNNTQDLDSIFYSLINELPLGWQYPDYCEARIVFDKDVYEPQGFKPTEWVQKEDIMIQNEVFGSIEIYYTVEMPKADNGPFLKEEQKLIKTIADRISIFILHQRFSDVFKEWQSRRDEKTGKPKPEWRVILDLLKRTDQHTFSIISRKMINHLFYKGIDEAKFLFKKLGNVDEENSQTEVNRPTKKQMLEHSFNLGEEVFTIASIYLRDDEILSSIQKWINEEKANFLVKSLANLSTPLAEIADAIRRYYHINPEHSDDRSAVSEGIRVSLIRRFLTDQLDFINIAKSFCDVNDFYMLLQNLIFPPESHGKIGGKGAGLFLAQKIVSKSPRFDNILGDVKTPKTWYITSDAIMNFIYYNNLEDIIEQRYKGIEEIRQEYPHIIQAFKNAHFPPEISNGMSRALDDFGTTPLIVRSSSLLEDRMGSAFAGKYKSLFLANQGSKQQRLEALMDAVSEVYASVFGPDPIGYRLERGLIDFHEEMGILVQEVVGKRIGKYYFPAFAGVAFSNNEFRWAPRIKRDDGLIRTVPGLGTRAVDRIGDDYPILIAPGKPDMRVNLSFDDILSYSPKNIDVINLETNTFETLPLNEVLEDVGNNFPMMNEIFSIVEERHLRTPIGLGIDTKKHKDLAVTFDNMINNTDYVYQINEILKILKEKLRVPVDIEFACDGNNLYLLQCRPQSSSSENISAIIPKDISRERVLFSANKFVSNGKVPDINYIVYIDPLEYSKLGDLNYLRDVGTAVGKLNKLLPKKNFILMGPGRWGSRDDIRLGVKVSYSDINNTAVLIEMATKKGNYVPDLSFGTHFFQDLVEASIRYLPLYPDDDEIIFNNKFLLESENILDRFIPEYPHIKKCLRVINVPESARGMVLRILMNADEDEAMAIFTEPSAKSVYQTPGIIKDENLLDEPWKWRARVAEMLAYNIDRVRFGVKGVYLFGTVFNKNATNNSDIDLLIHHNASPRQLDELKIWLEGWNLCLSEFNYRQSGYKVKNILDAYYITDSEFGHQKYFADMTDRSKNLAKRLKLKDEE